MAPESDLSGVERLAGFERRDDMDTPESDLSGVESVLDRIASKRRWALNRTLVVLKDGPQPTDDSPF